MLRIIKPASQPLADYGTAYRAEPPHQVDNVQRRLAVIDSLAPQKGPAFARGNASGGQPASNNQWTLGLSKLIASDEVHPGIISALGLAAGGSLKESSGTR